MGLWCQMKINAELVVALRTKRSWSQDELSIASGLNLRTIQRIENEASASLQSKKALASVFGIDIHDLVYVEKPTVTKYEYKSVEMPFRFGVLKQGTPDIEKVLNAEGDKGWRLHQIITPAGASFGQSDRMIVIFERERTA
jgi:transcriptional regulator with XRE-family HTH domain